MLLAGPAPAAELTLTASPEAMETRRRRPVGDRAVPRRRGPSPLLAIFGGCFSVVFAVLSFSRGWTGGGLVLDGPGTSLYVRLVLDHLRAGNGVPYWMPEMWSGAPTWALGPSFPVLLLLPLGAVIGPDEAVKAAILSLQVAGGCGAFVLARSLWGRTFPAVTAGLVYGLHPFFMSHGAFAGAETSLGVIAVTPWLVWSLRLALRRRGGQYVALAGLFSAFAILQQAEHAYGVAMLCALLVLVELARARREKPGPEGRAGVLFRAGVVILIGLGAVAHWLAPFLALGKYFVLSPPELVRSELLAPQNTGARVAQDLGIFLDRSNGFPSLYGADLLTVGTFYLSWVLIAVSLVTIVLLPRRDRDGYLTTILLASLVGVWLSTGAIPLASSDLAQPGNLLGLTIIGAVAGVLVGTFLRCLGLRRSAVPSAVAAAFLLALVPYLTPFLGLQQVVPFLSSIRFPRFYTIAPLGLALAGAYPLTCVQSWAAVRQPRLAPLFTAAVSMALVGAFLVDVAPYRSFYRLLPPERKPEDVQTANILAGADKDLRLGTDNYGDPGFVTALLDTGRDLSVGWPHPVAGKQLWALTTEAMSGPLGYRLNALGLSATEYVMKQQYADGDPDADVFALQELQRLEANPRVRPMVRAYEQAMVVKDRSLAPVLAATLAHRNISVVSGDGRTEVALGPIAGDVVGSPDPCREAAATGLENGVAGEVFAACAMNRWLGTTTGTAAMSAGSVGGTFLSPAPGLRGVTVWLDRVPGPTELVLHEMAADGHSPGREVWRGVASDTDENEMAAFVFEPIPGSAGTRYLFSLSCPRCDPADRPRMVEGLDHKGPANLVIDGELQLGRTASFSLVYERMPAAADPGTLLEATRSGPGKWRIGSSGSRPALIVVAETYFPGWVAHVDGKRTPVLEADGAFVGVPVGAGDHRVTLEYTKPAAATVGRVVTMATLLLSAALLLYPLGRRRRASRQHSHALEVGPPPVDGLGQVLFHPAYRHPRAASANGKRPGGKGDEAVLAPVGHHQPGLRQQPE